MARRSTLVRVALAFSAVASLVLVIPSIAFADVHSGDGWSAGFGDMGMGWEVTAPTAGAMSTAVGEHAVSVKISQYSTSIGAPPDPTETTRVGLVYTCQTAASGGAFSYVTDVVFTTSHTWASWDVLNYSPTVRVCTETGQSVYYLGLIVRTWSNVFDDENTGDFSVKLSVGSLRCPYTGSTSYCDDGVSSAGGLSITGHSDLGSGDEWLDFSWTMDPFCADAPNGHPKGLIVILSSSSAGSMTTLLGQPDSSGQLLDADTGDPLPANAQSPYLWTYVTGTSGTARIQLDPVPGEWSSPTISDTQTYGFYCAIGDTYYSMDNWLDVYTCLHSADGDCRLDMGSATYVPGAEETHCGGVFDAGDPNTWWAAQCQTVLELQKANGLLQQINAGVRDIHVDVSVSGGGGDGSGTVDTTGCGSGFVTSLVCLTKNIADALAGLTDLFVTLFVPSSASLSALSDLSSNFSTHPPGSLVTGTVVGMTTAVSDMSSDECTELPAINFGDSGPLHGISVDYPAVCGGTGWTSSAQFQACYQLVQFAFFGLLVFALWRMASQAFGSKGSEG